MKDVAHRAPSGYADVLGRVSARAAAAVIAKGHVRSAALRGALAAELAGPHPFVGDPVLEAARAWEVADRTLGELDGAPLHPDLVAALAGAGPQAWARDRAPYRHQLAAWEAGLGGRSFMVTSGTGSGKTECFMVPMLSDLLGVAGDRKLRGIHAVLLYPLNALIDSQRERLGAWMDPLRDRLSYALYNGDMKERRPGPDRRRGAEVRDREGLRAEAPPVLVTNVTMLEYMLMRAQDRTLLDASRGRLRWIVLDEAHSYVGAQAAEMALLLRRVRQAFGVAPGAVRLACTSATIGDEGADEDLRRFVADLAGIEQAGVDVIRGVEALPRLPPVGADSPLDPDLLPADPVGLWRALAPHPRVRRARDMMRGGGATLGRLAEALGTGDRPRALALLEAAAWAADPASDPKRPLRFAPWRMHAFHRAQAGLWACVDPACRERQEALRAEEGDWPWGRLHLAAAERCGCGAPVLEVGACDECGAPWLLATLERGLHERVLPRRERANDEDDYRLDVEPEEGAEAPAADADVLIGPPRGDAQELLRLADSVLLSRVEAGERAVAVRRVEDARERACCGRAHEARVAVRPQRFGAPFLMGNAMPMLLEASAEGERPADSPMGGRRLLSFTDSRQGTARFAAKLQQEAERALTRSVIYHAVQGAGQGDPEAAARLKAEIAALEPMSASSSVVRDMVQRLKGELAQAGGGGRGALSWKDMLDTLARHPEVERFAVEVWAGRPEAPRTSAELAEFFLLRELFRRPRMQNNAETMGLARIEFPRLAERARHAVPREIEEAKLGAAEWADVLHAAVDIVFRATFAVHMCAKPDMRHWISPKGALSGVVDPAAPPGETGGLRKPIAFPSARSKGTLTALLYRLLQGSPDSGIDQARVATILSAIWAALTASQVIQRAGPAVWRLDLPRAEVVRLDRAFLCPITNRLLPYAPGGLSLNALDAAPTTPVAMPRLPLARPLGATPAERDELRTWLAADPVVADLRRRGLWGDLHDRVAEAAPFLRAQEHSAQIDRPSLKRYEVAFKAGRINVLNCSTTMEMGVDIADVGVVVNTNVPPAPANYRQRVGRAGRRGEPWALSFTFCKDTPLDRAVWHDSARLLGAAVPAPKVRLDGATIVQRHVNALLLGMHLRVEAGGINVTMGTGTFFGATDRPEAPWEDGPPADLFLAALRGAWGASAEVTSALRPLVAGTVLAGSDALVARAAAAFGDLHGRWRAEYGQVLAAQAAAPASDPAHALYRNRARRMRGDFVITELARRGFTPAYGFPVDVVTFDHPRPFPGDARPAWKGPSRSLDVAVREYSPGSEVVVDGLVHRSEGILPIWGNRHDPAQVEDLRSLWRCRSCGAFGTSRMTVEACPHCEGAVERGAILRPTGFLGLRTPHASYEALDFVAPDPPRLQLDGAPWASLADPGLGRVRASREARLLVTASGPQGTGYAVCIACGRAEAEGADADAPLPAGMRDHFPLQRGKGEGRRDNRCSGNDPGSRRVQRHVRLGHEQLTDAVELQLEALPVTLNGEAAALAVAAALREALARRLGLDAEDAMGVAVAPRRRSDGAARVSLFLYDRASGGSGFAVIAAENLAPLLREAAAVLRCPADCPCGCPDCVLRADLQHGRRPLDRLGALDLLEREVLPRLDPPAELRVFGPATQVLPNPAEAILLGRIGAGATRSLGLVLHDDPGGWDLSDWPGARVLAQARGAGVETALLVPRAALGRMDLAQKLDLVRVAARAEAVLHGIETTPAQGPAGVLALRWGNGSCEAVASIDLAAARPGPGWGSAAEAPLLVGHMEPPDLGPRLSLSKVALFREANAFHAEVGAELDGPVGRFGGGFWRRVAALRPAAFEGRLVALTYRDRYLRSPLALRLLAEVARTAPGRSAATAVAVLTSRVEPGTRLPPRTLRDDWADDRLREAVIAQALGARQVELRPLRDCPHPRSLELRFEGGRRVTVHLDQGMGAWQPERAVPFDGGAEADRQAAALLRLTFGVVRTNLTTSPLWVTIGDG